MRIDNANLKEGARRIIAQNLGLRPGEDVVILVDELTDRVGRILAGAARHDGVRATIITILQQDQPRFSGNDKLPLPLARAIESAQAVIISLSDQPEGTGFRRHILNRSRQITTKVALMPGVTLEMISELANLDYSLMISFCNALQKPLLLGKRVMITTIDRDKMHHEIYLELGSWMQPPTISSGIVHPQSFDNIPSGEVYIAPIKGTANGEIIINGSVTGYVFGERDEIMLTFRDGMLVSMLPSEHPAATFLQNAITNARAKGDREPNFLCELGIGVVPNITRLTGNTLQDEKAYHTAHIAIGLNEPFGGDVDAHHIHEDIIFLRPTIKIDGKPLLDNGEFNIQEKDWRFNFREVKILPPYDAPEIMVNLSGNDAEIRAHDMLFRVYFDGTGAKASIQVGDNETSVLAGKIYKYLSQSGGVPLETLSAAIGLSSLLVRSVLQIMGEIFALIAIDPIP